jgi:hypothetical protein
MTATELRSANKNYLASGDAGDDVAIDGVAFLGPVDGDPERLPRFSSITLLSVMARSAQAWNSMGHLT